MDAPVAPKVEEAISAALARSQIYRLLALAFRYPDAETPGLLKRLVPAVNAEALAEGAQDLSRALSELASAAEGATADALREQYVAAFGHVTVPDCPLYETACGTGDPFRQAQSLADIAGFYRAFGLDMASGAGERADHLAVELEFIHYLAYREAYALRHHAPEQVAVIREGERRFLEEHLGRWGPVVARAVAGRADGALGAAARLLERFLADEARR